MVGEHLRVILGTPEALDPLCRVAVLRRTVGARDLAVGDVANECMGERELALALDRRTALLAYESLACERVKGGRRLVRLAAQRPVQKTFPRTEASRRSSFSSRCQSVEARRDDALESLGQGERLGRTLLEEELRELLGVERIAARSLEQHELRVGGEHGPIEKPAEEESGLLVGERRKSEGRRVQLAAAPTRPSLEKLRPGGRDDEERNVGHPVDELVEEVEQAVVGPVQVLHHEDERPLMGQRLEEVPPRGERFASPVACRARFRCEADEREKVRLDPDGIGPSSIASSTARWIFAAASAGGSCSWMPACALTISPSAHSVIPSP